MHKLLGFFFLLIISSSLFGQVEEDSTVIEDDLIGTIEESIQLYQAENRNQKNYDSLIAALGYERNHVPQFSDSTYCMRMAEMNEHTPFRFDCHPAALSTIRFFNEKRRGFLKIAMGRSALYFDLYEEALDRYKMPLELKYLSVIESGLRPQIKSRAGALGLWQFMYGTGKMYGLQEDAYIDERMDPYKSTDAACRYLKRLFAMYNDWNMALAAYNAGPGNINKAIRRSGGKMTYWEIRPFLPRETQGYVPNFIAVAYLLEHAAQHNLSPAPAKIYPYQLDTICLKTSMHMPTLDSVLDWPLADIQYLNPIYKTTYIPKTTPPQCITMPIEKIAIFIDLEDSIYRMDSTIYAVPLITPTSETGTEISTTSTSSENTQYHKVRSGETLGGIAEKYRTTVSHLMSWNHLRSSNINVGQVLTVNSAYVPKTVAPEKTSTPTTTASSSGAKKYHSVKSGESFWNISQQYGITITQLQELNPNVSSSNLKIGQSIRVQ